MGTTARHYKPKEREMTKLSVFTSIAVLVLLVACVATRADAQSLPVVGYPTTITAGAFFPSGGTAKQNGGSSQLYVELRYGFPVSVPLTPTRTVVSVGAEFGDANGGHSTIVPITIGEYWGAGGKSPFAANNYYVGAGVGPYIENMSGISTKAEFGGYGTIGYNIGLGFFVDAKYQVVANGSGTLVGAGFRF
jgi:hypothetical protein